MVSNVIFNDVWGIEIAFEMTLLAIASFSIVYAFISYMRNRFREALIGGLISTILPISALMILYHDLLKPEAAYLIFLSFQLRSWMVYGATGISLLIILSLLFSIAIKIGINKSIVKILGILASATGIFVSIYPGLLLSYERGIPFWHGCALPVSSLLMGLVGGSSVYMLLRPLDRRISIVYGTSLIALLIVYLIHIYFIWIYPLGSYTIELMLRDPVFTTGMAISFIGGFLGLTPLTNKNKFMSLVIAVIGLVSIFILRYMLLKYGAWEYPLI